MNQPKIGITMDYQEEKTYSKYPWYALRKNYATSIYKQGAIPVALIPDISLLEEYISMIDGLLITGGDFDVSPSLYGEEITSQAVSENTQRTDFEFLIIKKALQKDMPILGICGGQQILNVVLGGTLVQHISDSYDSPINHEQINPRNEVSHEVDIAQNTLLKDIVKETRIFVNSAHHQAVKKVGKGVVKNAIATDNVVEGIEATNYKFCLGIQWHPEFLITQADSKIMNAFVKACK